jgi:predicted nuclease with RNAse H fold
MFQSPSTPLLTRHAAKRVRQRGIAADAVGLVHAFADIELPAGGGCERRLLSRRAELELLADGWPAALVDRAARLTVVVASDGRTVVSVWPRSSDSRLVRARRPRRTGR